MLSLNAWCCRSLTALAVLLTPYLAHAETVGEYLRKFHQNPARMMERLPSVLNAKGEAIPRGFINYKALAATHQERMDAREQIMGLETRSLITALPVPDSGDSVERLLDPGATVERNIDNLKSFQYAESKIQPWADSYWPTYRGQIAYRYADGRVPNSKSWDVHYGFAQSHPASGIVATGNVSLINLLSPAEKYDFVMGDPSFSLTRYSWLQGQKRADEGRGVATWMGICHGWSAASHMGAPFPKQPVVVYSRTGVPVTFFPQDVKALQSMLWANGSPDSRFVGNRCNVYRPRKNAYGRIVDPVCFDTNPSVWHLAVTNQLGRNQRSFVFDATYDAEVWNFPVLSARINYFQPQTFEQKQNWQDAAIPLSDYRLDKFREFRPKEAVSVVGVYMDVTYVIEIEPGQNRVNDMPTKTVRYIYDLELDANNNVIGGEWYSNAHPDFIWTYDPNAQAMARNESTILEDAWDLRTPVPANWTSIAQSASSRGVPLFSFLKKVGTADQASPPQP